MAVPPLNVNSVLPPGLLQWYYSTSDLTEPNVPVSEQERVQLTKSLQLIILDVPAIFNGRIYQVVHTNFALGTVVKSKKFQLVVTGNINTFAAFIKFTYLDTNLYICIMYISVFIFPQVVKSIGFSFTS